MKSPTESGAFEPDIITKAELARRIGASTRLVDQMVRKRMISCFKLGHRTQRFSWAKAQQELARFEIKAVTLR